MMGASMGGSSGSCRLTSVHVQAALAAVLSPSKRPTTDVVQWLRMTEKAIGDGHAAARLSAKVRRDVPPWG